MVIVLMAVAATVKIVVIVGEIFHLAASTPDLFLGKHGITAQLFSLCQDSSRVQISDG